MHGEQDQKLEVFDITVQAVKCLSLSLPGETKDSVSVKKLMAGEGDWTCKKEVLGWLINTEAGTVALPEQKHLEFLQLLTILATQRRMVRKELESLVGKLCSMYLAVPRAVAHLYHIQRALTQGGKYKAWLLGEPHREIDNWGALVAQTVA